MKICIECEHYMNKHMECDRKKKEIDRHNGRQKYACVINERTWPSILWWMCGKQGRFFRREEP
jgi:hypothetical protein